MSTSWEAECIRNTYHEILPFRSNQNKAIHVRTDLQKLFVLTFIYLTCEKFESRNGHLDACRRRIIEFD